MGAIAVKKEKNSLIELGRFLFALWVLYYHSYVPFKNENWSDGFLAVEFFFILSGFYLIRSIDKYTSMPIRKGLPEFLKHRFSAIAVPFLINEIFVLYHSLCVEPSYNLLFGFLWYIRDLFIAMTAIFLLRKYVKNEKAFYILLSAASLTALFAFCWFPIMAWPGGPFRSVASIPIGMLAALIPKITPQKDNKKKNILPKLLIAVGFAVTLISCFLIVFSTEKSTFIKYLLVLVVYPAMLYFTSCIKFNNSFLNWLGSLSFPIYAFQCPLRVLEHYGVNDETVLFIVLISMVLCYSAVTEFIKWRKKRKICSKNEVAHMN